VPASRDQSCDFVGLVGEENIELRDASVAFPAICDRENIPSGVE